MDEKFDISLLPYNTFRMDVKAKVYAEYQSVEDLRALLAKYRSQKILPIGQGSNLLFTRDFDGVVLRSQMVRARALGENGDEVFIEADGGLVLDELIAQVTDMGLTGLENLSYIPGTVGASAVQNVGAYGVEAKDVIVSVRAIAIADGAERVFTNEECRFGYRDSIFKNELKGQYVIVAVTYRLYKHGELRLEYKGLEGATSAAQVRERVIAIRQTKLPEVSELGSAGSFFKNPVISAAQYQSLLQTYPTMPHYDVADGVKVPAAWLIEQCGYKGKTLGGAQVYDKQPLVIVNATGHAQPTDIVHLAQNICDDVKKTFGISISPEVNYI